jgi:hypothetical protein
MRASTWPAASLEVVPAGFEADADGEEEAGEVGLDGDEEDGAEEDGPDEDDADEDDAGEEGPPPGCREWARDGVGCTDRGTDGLAVTAPNGWPAHGAASVAGPTAPASAPDAADSAAPWAAAPWAGAQEAGAGRSVRVPDVVGAGPFLLAR